MKNYRIIFKDNEDSYTYTGKYIGIESFANTKYLTLVFSMGSETKIPD